MWATLGSNTQVHWQMASSSSELEIDTDTQDPAPNKINLDAIKKKNLSINEINNLISTIKQQHKQEDASKVVMQTIPPKPTLPVLESLNFDGKLEVFQEYITKFEYNFTTMQLSTYQKVSSLSVHVFQFSNE